MDNITFYQPKRSPPNVRTWTRPVWIEPPYARDTRTAVGTAPQQGNSADSAIVLDDSLLELDGASTIDDAQTTQSGLHPPLDEEEEEDAGITDQPSPPIPLANDAAKDAFGTNTAPSPPDPPTADTQNALDSICEDFGKSVDDLFGDDNLPITNEWWAREDVLEQNGSNDEGNVSDSDPMDHPPSVVNPGRLGKLSDEVPLSDPEADTSQDEAIVLPDGDSGPESDTDYAFEFGDDVAGDPTIQSVDDGKSITTGSDLNDIPSTPPQPRQTEFQGQTAVESTDKKEQEYSSESDDSSVHIRRRSNNKQTQDDAFFTIPRPVKRLRSPFKPQTPTKRRRQRRHLFSAPTPVSGDESDDGTDSQMSNYTSNSGSDGSLSSKTSCSSDASSRSSSNEASRSSYIRSRDLFGPSFLAKGPVADLAKPLPLPVAGFVHMTESGSIVLTLGPLASPFSQHPPSALQFKSGDSSTRFEARLKSFAGVTPSLKEGRALVRSKTRFTLEEDEMLIDLKEKKGFSWVQIEGRFPLRSRGTLQVHYSKKLKDRGV